MELSLIRSVLTTKSTIGRLYVNGKFECYTLEDRVREGPKIKHQTAIPAGRYRVRVGHSPRFGKPMPRIEDVPNFTGILIHTGNHAGHTSGCILVGKSTATDWIGQSRVAFAALFAKIKAATGPVWITIATEAAAPTGDS